MAISKNGILGEFSGKVGNVVGVQLKGKNILRAAPKPSKKPPTEKQRLQRLKFSLALELIKPFLEIVERFFDNHVTAGERKAKVISYVLNHVIATHGKEFSVIWSKFLLSSGVLSGFHQLETQFLGKELLLHWKDNAHQGLAHPDDEVHLVMASENLLHVEFIEKWATRMDEQAKITLPSWLEQETGYLYVFMSNATKTQSCNSFFLGKISGGVVVERE